MTVCRSALLLSSLLLLSIFTTGCAAPMSTFTTGKTTPRNKVQLVTGLGLNLSSSFLSSVIDNAETAADKVEQTASTGSADPLNEAELRDLMRAAFTYALLGPTPLWEIGLRYGILDRWDAGVAYTSSGFRFDTKVQLLKHNAADPGRSDAPIDLALGLSAQRQVFEIPAPSFLKDVFEIEDLSRTDLHIPLIASRHFGHIGFLYGGPKFFYSWLNASVLEAISAESGQGITSDTNMWGAGGVLGGGLGYKYVHVLLELNVLYYSYGATLLDTPVDLSGVNFYPAVGLKVNFYSLGGA